MENFLPFLAYDFMGKPAWVWLVFVGIVVTLLAFDLGVLHKDEHGNRRAREPAAVGRLHQRGIDVRRLGVVVSWARKAAWTTSPAS